nr:uncharacterized protein CFP56_08497 [Quercus suber]
MEEDEESDEEVENLHEWLVVVRFSRGFKKQIRTPWTRAIIVKVYGRSVTLNFLHNRLLSIWKPTGRLDCVDLEHGFFLTQFYLRDDYEATLKKGPWFIGEHFLSIKPWEPNFHLESANVTSVAVWIRLNGLPIEYYNLEALLQIGKATGNVLRVDTHTANEARGRFARLCVQVDVEKPLVTAVLIGRFEQPMCYEAYKSYAFLVEKWVIERKDVHSWFGEGPSSVVHGSAHEKAQEGSYGPWTIVTNQVTTGILQVEPWAEREGNKHQQKNNVSVKGKKAIARARVSLEASISAEKDKAISPLSQKNFNIQKLHSLNIPKSGVQTSNVQPSRDGESKQSGEGSSSSRVLAEFQFASVSWEEMGCNHGRDRGASGESCKLSSGDGLVQQQVLEGVGNTGLPSNCGVQSSWVGTGNGDGSDVAQHNVVSRRRPNEGDAEVDRMELEGGGEIPTAV